MAVLVAVAIPVFTTQLEKARDATSIANLRAGYADAMAEYLLDYAGTNKIIEKEIMIQTAQENSWSGEDSNLPFTPPEDPGSITTSTAKAVNYSFTVDTTTGDVSVTAAWKS